MVMEVRHPVNDEVQSNDNATWTYRLPKDGALHTLMLGAAATNGATSGRGVSIFDVVDLIEVVADGSKILYSLQPEEIEKWYETLQGQGLDIVQNEAASAVQRGVFPLMFGRELYDREMYLPLNRFNDVQLRVSYSPTIAADAGFATGTVTFDVQMLFTPQAEAGPYLGTLITKTVKNFTSAASGDEATELALLNRFRAIGIYMYEAGVDPLTDITRIVLRADSGARNLFDADILQFYQLNQMLFGAHVEHHAHLFLQDTETADLRLGNIRSYSVSINEDVSIANDTVPVVQVDTIAGDRVTFNMSTIDVTAGSEDLTALTSDQDVFISVTGLSPSYFGLIPFTYIDTPEGYLNSQAYSELEVVLTQGGAGATVRIATQELETL